VTWSKGPRQDRQTRIKLGRAPVDIIATRKSPRVFSAGRRRMGGHEGRCVEISLLENRDLCLGSPRSPFQSVDGLVDPALAVSPVNHHLLLEVSYLCVELVQHRTDTFFLITVPLELLGFHRLNRGSIRRFRFHVSASPPHSSFFLVSWNTRDRRDSSAHSRSLRSSRPRVSDR